MEVRGDLPNVGTVGPGTGIAMVDAAANTGTTTTTLRFGNPATASGEGSGGKLHSSGHRYGQDYTATISDFFGCR